MYIPVKCWKQAVLIYWIEPCTSLSNYLISCLNPLSKMAQKHVQTMNVAVLAVLVDLSVSAFHLKGLMCAEFLNLSHTLVEGRSRCLAQNPSLWTCWNPNRNILSALLPWFHIIPHQRNIEEYLGVEVTASVMDDPKDQIREKANNLSRASNAFSPKASMSILGAKVS